MWRPCFGRQRAFLQFSKRAADRFGRKAKVASDFVSLHGQGQWSDQHLPLFVQSAELGQEIGHTLGGFESAHYRQTMTSLLERVR